MSTTSSMRRSTPTPGRCCVGPAARAEVARSRWRRSRAWCRTRSHRPSGCTFHTRCPEIIAGVCDARCRSGAAAARRRGPLPAHEPEALARLAWRTGGNRHASPGCTDHRPTVRPEPETVARGARPRDAFPDPAGAPAPHRRPRQGGRRRQLRRRCTARRWASSANPAAARRRPGAPCCAIMQPTAGSVLYRRRGGATVDLAERRQARAAGGPPRDADGLPGPALLAQPAPAGARHRRRSR